MRKILLTIIILILVKAVTAQTKMYSRIDSTLIGVELGEVLKSLSINYDNVSAIEEPPGILRGVEGILNDSTEFMFYVERTTTIGLKPTAPHYSKVLNKKIIGLAYADLKGNQKYHGAVIAYYEIRNRYLEE